MQTVSFTVFGTARPKGSHKPFLHPKTKQIIMKPASSGLRAWESATREQAHELAKRGVFFGGPVRVIVTFTFARPKSVSEKKRAYMTVAPDLEKLARGLFDPLTKVIWRDDAQVVELVARKVYGASDEASRAEVTITELAPVELKKPLLASPQEDLYASPSDETEDRRLSTHRAG